MMSVYANDDASGPVDPVTPLEEEGYLGCFADAKDDRVFEPAIMDGSEMSAAVRAALLFFLHALVVAVVFGRRSGWLLFG